MKEIIMKGKMTISKVKLCTGVQRIDFNARSPPKYEVYGLWYRGTVFDLKPNESLSILSSKK